MAKKFTISDDVVSDDINRWSNHAACKGQPAEWWYTDSYTTSQGRADTQRAKLHCYQCLVRERCLQYAIENDESYGVWGGLTPHERGYKRKGRATRIQPSEQ